MYGADVIAKLLQSLYGSRDASANWEFTIRGVLVEELDFVQDRASPCNYWHERAATAARQRPQRRLHDTWNP